MLRSDEGGNWRRKKLSWSLSRSIQLQLGSLNVCGDGRQMKVVRASSERARPTVLHVMVDE